MMTVPLAGRLRRQRQRLRRSGAELRRRSDSSRRRSARGSRLRSARCGGCRRSTPCACWAPWTLPALPRQIFLPSLHNAAHHRCWRPTGEASLRHYSTGPSRCVGLELPQNGVWCLSGAWLIMKYYYCSGYALCSLDATGYHDRGAAAEGGHSGGDADGWQCFGRRG